MTANGKTIPLKNGKWKEFNKHAVLIAEGYFINGKKHGLWREYYDSDGALMIEENYRHDVSHGRFTSYHPNGVLLSEGEFRNGLREGHFRIYDDNGRNIKNIFFINDREVEGVDENRDGHKTAG
jgi:antitoxin component YwqK of YwqJK toxin-antitoxin module